MKGYGSTYYVQLTPEQASQVEKFKDEDDVPIQRTQKEKFIAALVDSLKNPNLPLPDAYCGTDSAKVLGDGSLETGPLYGADGCTRCQAISRVSGLPEGWTLGAKVFVERDKAELGRKVAEALYLINNEQAHLPKNTILSARQKAGLSDETETFVLDTLKYVGSVEGCPLYGKFELEPDGCGLSKTSEFASSLKGLVETFQLNPEKSREIILQAWLAAQEVFPEAFRERSPIAIRSTGMKVIHHVAAKCSRDLRKLPMGSPKYREVLKRVFEELSRTTIREAKQNITWRGLKMTNEQLAPAAPGSRMDSILRVIDVRVEAILDQLSL